MSTNMTVPTRTNLLSMGHAQHGKSSLMGALIYSVDIRNRPKSLVEWEHLFNSWRKESWWREHRAFAFVLDRTKEERVVEKSHTRVGQSISRTFHDIAINQRPFMVIDSPGHIDLFKNFMVGFTQADVGVLVVAANRVEEAWRSYEDLQRKDIKDWKQAGGAWVHSLLRGVFGLTHLIVAITKMDLSDYSKAHFEEAKEYSLKKIQSLGYYKSDKIPILPTCVYPSKLKSKNVAKNNEPAFDWHDGPTVEEAISTLPIPKRDVTSPVRLLIDSVRPLRGTYIISGELISGTLKLGDNVTIAPNQFGDSIQARVKRLFSLGDPAFLGFGEVQTVQRAHAGDIIGVDCGWGAGIREEIKRGAIMTSQESPVKVTTQLKARIFIMKSVSPIRVGATELDFHLGTFQSSCIISNIPELHHSVSANSNNFNALRSGDNATVILESRLPTPVDVSIDNPRLQRLALLQQGFVIGGGVLIAPL